MLWVNLIMDTFAALALATEAPYDSILEREPYHKHDSIVTEPMWRNVFGHAIYQAIAIFTVIFAGQYIGLCKPYETSCMSTEFFHDPIENKDGYITRIQYCTKFNPWYAKKFYTTKEDVLYWENAFTLRDGIEDDTTEPLADQKRKLVYEDFDEPSLIEFMCDQYAHKKDEDIELELEENEKFN